MRLVLESFDLNAAERLLCVEALATAGSIVEAAPLLGIVSGLAPTPREVFREVAWVP